MLISGFLLGCKSGKTISERKATEEKAVLHILNAHYSNLSDFSTSIIRGSAYYRDHKQSQNVGVDIRIKKDEKILINIKVLGFSMAKALITPTEVSYYEKINNQYFTGDFGLLNQWLGADLDFQKVQNILLGTPFNTLEAAHLSSSLENGLHKLKPQANSTMDETYFFEDQLLLLKKEELKSRTNRSKVTISYPNYQKAGQHMMPSEIKIDAEQEKSIHLNITYDKVSFDEDISFPFSIPSNFKRISIN